MYQEEFNIYKVKILSQSKEIKRTGVLKKKEYYTSELENLYSEIFRKNHDVKGKLKLKIYNTDSDFKEEVSVEVTIDNNYSLLDLVVTAIQEQISKTDDEQERLSLADSEERISESWYLKLNENQEVEQRGFFSRKEKNEELDYIDTLDEDDIDDDTYDYDNGTYEDLKDDSVDLENSSNTYEEDNITDKKLSEKNLEENKGNSFSVNNKIDKTEFISLVGDNNINDLINQINNKFKKAIDLQSEFVLDALHLKPTSNKFIEDKRREYVKENYSTDEVNEVAKSISIDIENALNTTKTRLIEVYDKNMDYDNTSEMNKAIAKEIAKLNAEYVKNLEILEKDLSEQHGLQAQHLKSNQEKEVAELHTKHEKQLKDLQNKQIEESSKEFKWLKDNNQTAKEKIERTLSNKFEEEKFNTRNENAKIAREDLINQLDIALKEIDLASDKALSAIQEKWNILLEDKSQEFDESYEQYKAELREQEEKAERQKESDRKERELALKEKQASLEENQQTKLSVENQELTEQLKKLTKLVNEKELEQQERENDFFNTQYEFLKNRMDDTQALEDKSNSSSKINKFIPWILTGVTVLLGIGTVFMLNQHNEKALENQRIEFKKEQDLKVEQSRNAEALRQYSKQLDDLNNQKNEAEKQKSDLENRINELQKQVDDKKNEQK